MLILNLVLLYGVLGVLIFLGARHIFYLRREVAAFHRCNKTCLQRIDSLKQRIRRLEFTVEGSTEGPQAWWTSEQYERWMERAFR